MDVGISEACLQRAFVGVRQSLRVEGAIEARDRPTGSPVIVRLFPFALDCDCLRLYAQIGVRT